MSRPLSSVLHLESILLILAFLLLSTSCESTTPSEPNAEETDTQIAPDPDTTQITDFSDTTQTLDTTQAADTNTHDTNTIPPGGVHPIFDLNASQTGNTDFFSFPYPSDLRTTAGGYPDMSSFPTLNISLIQESASYIERDRPGFSPSTGIYFQFNGPIDPAGLPSPSTSTEKDASVFLVNIDPESPDLGKHHPIIVDFDPQGDRYTPDNLLSLGVVMGLTLRNGERYAAVVTKQLTDPEGEPLLENETFAAFKNGEGDPNMVEHFTGVFEQLESLGIDRNDLLSLTAFRTSDSVTDLQRIREVVYEQEMPTVSSWERAPNLGHLNYDVYFATFSTTEFFSGDAPYNQYFGAGGFEFDENGTPLNAQSNIPVVLAVAVPTTPQPTSGYPLLIYGHGTGGDHTSHLGNSSPSDFLSSEGIAVLGFDAPLHGARGELNPEALLLSNPVGAREIFRQHAIDLFVLFRIYSAGGFEIPSSATGGDPIVFSTGYNFYLGHSQGSQVAGMTLALEPNIKTAFFSGGGGGGIISVFERNFNGQPIICFIATLARLNCNTLTEEHPIARLIIQPLLDAADPAVFARHYIKEPLPGISPKNLAMTEGTLDEATPPRAIEALAAAAGIPIIKPVAQTSLPIELVGIPAETPPQSLNVSAPGGVQVTGGLMQWEGGSHFVIFQKADARNRYVQYFKSALTGSPVIVPPL